MEASFKRNVIFNMILNVTNVIFPLITAPYVSRVLGADNLGLSNFATTYVAYFVVFASLGLGTYGVREISKVKEKPAELQQTFGELFSISLYSTLIISLIYIATLVCVPQLHSNTLLLFVAGFLLFTLPFNVEWFFMGTEQFDFITIRSIVVKVISIILLFLFVRAPEDVVAYVSISVLAVLLNQVWNFVILIKSRIRFKLYYRDCSKHIKFLSVFFAANIATSAYNYIDVIMLGFLSELREVAFYSNAVHITKMIVSLTSSIAIVGLPRISSLYAEENYNEIQLLIDKAIALISFMVFPITIAIILISPTFVPCFFGEEYVDGSASLQVLSLVIVLIGFSYICSTMVLVAMGKERIAVRNTIIGACVNVVFNSFLIPVLGSVGASISSVTAEIIILFLNASYDARHFRFITIKMKPIWINLFISFVFIPIFALSCLFYDGWTHIIVFSVIGSFLYLLLQYICGNVFVSEAINRIRFRLKYN